VLGIGDDCAVLDAPGADYLLATVDMLVERVHFAPDAPPKVLGRRALAVNISDIAAMGGTPTAVLTSLCLPPSTEERWVLELYRGMADQAGQFGAGVVGGNLSRTDGPACIDVTVLGRVDKRYLVPRGGARVGDVIGVTGVLGSEAARHALSGSDAGLTVPQPRVAWGQAMARTGLVHAMIDISDGLAADVAHLAEASEVGAVLYAEQIPVSAAARQAGLRLSADPLGFALHGGEDYELLFTAAADAWSRLVAAAGSASLYQVGTVLDREQGVLLETAGGVRTPLEIRGWTHF
jgi:thiamine-monophosphate kinase